jgi:hypothetical protein
MSKKDSSYVNFSEEHELNSLLRKIGKRQTGDNRSLLKDMGAKLKSMLGKKILQQTEFQSYIESKKSELD